VAQRSQRLLRRVDRLIKPTRREVEFGHTPERQGDIAAAPQALRQGQRLVQQHPGSVELPLPRTGERAGPQPGAERLALARGAKHRAASWSRGSATSILPQLMCWKACRQSARPRSRALPT
jgi:hypothetical protein